MPKLKWNKRKIATILLLFTLFIPGCGKKEKTENNRESVLDFVDDKDKEKTTQEEKKDTPEEDDDKDSLSAPYIEILGDFVDNRYYEEGDLCLCSLSYNTIRANKDEYPELSSALDLWSLAREKELLYSLETYADTALMYPEEIEEYIENQYQCMYYIYQSLEIKRADGQVVSILESCNDYCGGAHGSYFNTGINFDSKTGKKLLVSDVLKDSDGFYPVASEYIIKELKRQDTDELLYEDYEEIIKNTIWNENLSWYFDATGITITFQPYELAPYGAGIFSVTLPYSEFENYLSEKYIDTSLEGVINLQPEEACSMKAKNGYMDVKIRIEEEDEDSFPRIFLCVGDEQDLIGEYSYVNDIYILKRKDNKVFLFITCDYMSSDYETLVFDITDGNVNLCDKMNNACINGGTINTESIVLDIHIDVLGSYISKTSYCINPDGTLNQIDDLYHIGFSSALYSDSILTTTRDLPVILNGKEDVLPAGSHISITGTDNESMISFYHHDSSLDGEIYFVRGDGNEDTWTIFIDGISEYEYFENLPYAG